MGLKNVLQKATGVAFKVLDDFQVTLTYWHVTGLEQHDTYQISGILGGYSQTEAMLSGGAVSSTDRKFMVQVETLNFIPTTDDYVFIPGHPHVQEAYPYSVVDVQRDPSESIFTLQLRSE